MLTKCLSNNRRNFSASASANSSSVLSKLFFAFAFAFAFDLILIHLFDNSQRCTHLLIFYPFQKTSEAVPFVKCAFVKCAFELCHCKKKPVTRFRHSSSESVVNTAF